MSSRANAGTDLRAHPQSTLSSGFQIDPGTIANLFAASLLLELPPLRVRIFTEHAEVYRDMTDMHLTDAPDNQQAFAFRLICTWTSLFTEQELGYRLILVKD